MSDGFFSDLQAAVGELPSAEALPVALSVGRGGGEASAQVNREFFDMWFSEGGRRRLGEARDRLLKRA